MAEELTPNPAQAQTHDAKLAAERMVEGEEKTPSVDVSEDYEASKQFSVSEVDRTGGGAAAAAAATAPQFKVSQPAETPYVAESTGNPDDYREMARDVSPASGGGNVTDELVQKAIDLGQPG